MMSSLKFWFLVLSLKWIKSPGPKTNGQASQQQPSEVVESPPAWVEGSALSHSPWRQLKGRESLSGFIMFIVGHAPGARSCTGHWL